MGKTGQHFSDFRKSTPKSVQWLLLVAAIIIVVVLLLLLMGGRQKKATVQTDDVFPTTPELRFEPNAPIDWANTLVDETRDAEIKVYSNARVQITNLVVQVEGEKDEDLELSASATCTNEQTFVTEDTPCLITLSYTPTHVIPRTNVGVAITWTAFDLGPDPIETPNAITAIIGAREKPKIEIASPAPDVKPEPKVTKEIEPVTEDPVDADVAELEGPEEEVFDEPDSEFQEDIEDIAPAVDFFEPTPKGITPSAPATVEKKYRSAFGNSCSDFSFPGYNMAGIQSGWIVPSGGAYYYHPFSDTNCETATGLYNADTGYIMDISNPTRKIGSDVEHIRFTVRERMPQLQGSSKSKATAGRASQRDDLNIQDAEPGDAQSLKDVPANRVNLKTTQRVAETYMGSGFTGGVVSSRPYDRTFVLRQYKPIPATIVSDIQADEKLLQGGLPVRATVDRNVYSDNGRTIIIPTGTLMLGYVTGELPGPYKAVGKMEIEWYQFIRPDGVEFNFNDKEKPKPFSADSQGRKGVPGHGSTDYLQQFVMPMLTAVVPAAVNLIAPISDSFVNQIDLDNNTVVQSGTVRSSEMAKNEIITAWNNVATKLLVDMMDNTTPPFSIAAGTRITVFSPVDLFVTCGQDDDAHNVNSKKCAFTRYPEGADAARADWTNNAKLTENLDELIGQVRSMMQSSLKEDCCTCKDGVCSADYDKSKSKVCTNYSFTTLDFYCRSFGTYEAINNAKQKAVYENQKEQAVKKSEYEDGPNTKEYNTQVLGLKYDDDGKIKDPFKTEKKEKAPAAAAQDSSVVTCDNGAHPDANGCCPGETYTDMGDQGFNCCPDAGGDCFPPIEM